MSSFVTQKMTRRLLRSVVGVAPLARTVRTATDDAADLETVNARVDHGPVRDAEAARRATVRAEPPPTEERQERRPTVVRSSNKNSTTSGSTRLLLLPRPPQDLMKGANRQMLNWERGSAVPRRRVRMGRSTTG